MKTENVGLTITYNRIKDTAVDQPTIRELRRLHEELDRAVLAVYAENDPKGNWSELDVPPFCLMNEGDSKKLHEFENAVIERLFLLNGRRAEKERISGLAEVPDNKKPEKSGITAAKKRPKTKKVTAQLELAKPATETKRSE
jgi:hypothetical protein